MKIVFPESHLNRAYSQASQSSKTQFCFLNKTSEFEYTAVFPLIICRDYFGDALWGQKFQKLASVFGYTFDPKEHHIDEDACRILIYSSCQKELDYTKEHWHTLNNIEDINKIPRSELIEHSQNGKNYLIVEADAFWQSHIWTISLFTFIIRCLCTKEFASSQTEASYKNQIGDNWQALLDNIRKIENKEKSLTGYKNEATFNVSKTHSYCGFIALFSQASYYCNPGENTFFDNFQKILKGEKVASTKKKRTPKSAAAPAIQF